MQMISLSLEYWNEYNFLNIWLMAALFFPHLVLDLAKLD